MSDPSATIQLTNYNQPTKEENKWLETENLSALKSQRQR
jgi:hypothetical protein